MHSYLHLFASEMKRQHRHASFLATSVPIVSRTPQENPTSKLPHFTVVIVIIIVKMTSMLRGTVGIIVVPLTAVLILSLIAILSCMLSSS